MLSEVKQTTYKQHTVRAENCAAMQMWSIIVLLDIYIYISGQKNIVNAVHIRILHQRKENKLGSNYQRCEVVANVQSSMKVCMHLSLRPNSLFVHVYLIFTCLIKLYIIYIGIYVCYICRLQETDGVWPKKH